MQRTPAGLPLGMPGIAEEILGAIQHAPQPRRQSIFYLLVITYLMRAPILADLFVLGSEIITLLSCSL